MTVQADRRIKVRSDAGEIEFLAPCAFREQFGVTYAASIRFDGDARPSPVFNPRECEDAKAQESRRAELQREFGLALGESDFFDADRARWLYRQKLRNSETADLYIAKVSEKIGYGIFAGSDIEPGELIGEYTGLVRPAGSVDDDYKNLYLFNYPGRFVVDARDQGNYTRYINHSQKKRNCHCAQTFIDGAHHILLLAIAPIAKGHQVLFDYGPGYWKRRGEPAEFE